LSRDNGTERLSDSGFSLDQMRTSLPENANPADERAHFTHTESLIVALSEVKWLSRRYVLRLY
jgi:hypothetical protein